MGLKLAATHLVDDILIFDQIVISDVIALKEYVSRFSDMPAKEMEVNVFKITL